MATSLIFFLTSQLPFSSLSFSGFPRSFSLSYSRLLLHFLVLFLLLLLPLLLFRCLYTHSFFPIALLVWNNRCLRERKLLLIDFLPTQILQHCRSGRAGRGREGRPGISGWRPGDELDRFLRDGATNTRFDGHLHRISWYLLIIHRRTEAPCGVLRHFQSKSSLGRPTENFTFPPENHCY